MIRASLIFASNHLNLLDRGSIESMNVADAATVSSKFQVSIPKALTRDPPQRGVDAGRPHVHAHTLDPLELLGREAVMEDGELSFRRSSATFTTQPQSVSVTIVT